MFRQLSVLFLLLLQCISSACAEPQEAMQQLVIEDSWIAEAPPVSKVMVAYMTIRNDSAQGVRIVKADSGSYSSIEFHETRHIDGMARMFRHEALYIPAGASVELKRGGKHMMLFNPVQAMKAGDTVTIQLTSDQGHSRSIDVPVIKP